VSLAPEQVRAMDYLRRKGTETTTAELRAGIAAAFESLEATLAGIQPAEARRAPFAGKWSVHEVVDHLVESHRPVPGQLAALLRGQRPEGTPIPAGLQSPDPAARSWEELVAELAAIHRGFLQALVAAPDGPPGPARAALVVVIKVEGEDGVERPAEWVEDLDWKAYALAIKVHSLEHKAQIERTLAAARGAVVQPGALAGS
jgi:hypothetical protein